MMGFGMPKVQAPQQSATRLPEFTPPAPPVQTPFENVPSPGVQAVTNALAGQQMQSPQQQPPMMSFPVADTPWPPPEMMHQPPQMQQPVPAPQPAPVPTAQQDIEPLRATGHSDPVIEATIKDLMRVSGLSRAQAITALQAQDMLGGRAGPPGAY